MILNGLTLNPNMVWLERYQPERVAQTTRRTLGGRAVLFAGSLGSGEPITLEATNDHGWLTNSDVLQLIAMADVPGATYTLTIDGVNRTVAFRSDSPPAVDFRPIVPRETHESTDWMIGQLKLITV